MNATDAEQGILHAPLFLFQLTGIVHVPEDAAAAAAKAFAFRRYAVTRWLLYPRKRRIGAGSAHMINFNAARLARNDARDKYDLSVNACDARALGSQAGDLYAVCFVFLHTLLSMFHVKHFTRLTVRRSTHQSGRRSHV